MNTDDYQLRSGIGLANSALAPVGPSLTHPSLWAKEWFVAAVEREIADIDSGLSTNEI